METGNDAPGNPAYRRQQLELWIEQAIALLDALDVDTDLEAGADLERDETEVISDLRGADLASDHARVTSR